MTTQEHVHSGELLRATAGEWSKLWSARSTLWCLAGSVPLLITWVGIVGVALRTQLEKGSEGAQPIPPTQLSAEGVFYLAQFALAALVMAGEFASGSIRTTLRWAPVRHRMLLAKCLALAPVFFLAGFVLSILGRFLSNTMMGPDDVPYGVTDVFASAVGTGIYLLAVGFITVSLGAIVRSVAGLLTVAFVLLTGLSAAGGTLSWLPSEAGQTLMAEGPSVFPLVVTVVWIVVVVAAAIGVLRVQDP